MNREELVIKIRQTEEDRKRAKNPKRKKDLGKHLRRLYRELHDFDRFTQNRYKPS